MLMTSAAQPLAPGPKLAIRYAAFGAISTIANIGTQALAFRLAPVAPLTLSMIAGTVLGFVVKYVLDKHWIFFDGFTSYGHEARKIVLYGLFGVAMTVVFWGTELGFLAIWQTSFAKYVGAVVGLAIGYTAKYLLDARFVFRPASA
jgi:putative flippase GtrA